MSYIDKNEIHKLVDMCEDEAILYEIKERLSGNGKDWWDELSKEEQDEILESTKQVEAGHFTTNEEAMKIFDKWLKK